MQYTIEVADEKLRTYFFYFLTLCEDQIRFCILNRSQVINDETRIIIILDSIDYIYDKNERDQNL